MHEQAAEMEMTACLTLGGDPDGDASKAPAGARQASASSKNDAASAHNARIVEEDADINLKYFYWSRVLDEGKIPPADTHKDIKGEWVIHTSDGRVRVMSVCASRAFAGGGW